MMWVMMNGRRTTMQILTVKDVLIALGATRAQLYYWEETGKIPPARRTSTGKRYYLPVDVEKIKGALHAGAKESCRVSSVKEC